MWRIFFHPVEHLVFFSDGTPLGDVIVKLMDGDITAEDIPPLDISIDEDGRWWSSSNRRLFVFKVLGMQPRLRIRKWNYEFESKLRALHARIVPPGPYAKRCAKTVSSNSASDQANKN